ncbi:uncharacterized protein EHS24_002106 [Apiotrichum porosum]|uniref:Uncharacterized protein n=1 Tax=Apiotrichum porosum TaxID=105984 RepID=A0A427XHM2_9TREE|nr:uncharacterized protein EHS24_002106 [Apiotrichum porosum]RSH78381.1 hypothetical protein EHS24_002106 [Apiotrichum porosum]
MTLFNRSPSPKVSSRRQSHSGPVDLEHCPGDKNGANKDEHCVTVDVERNGLTYHQCFFCRREVQQSEAIPPPKRQASQGPTACPSNPGQNCLSVQVKTGGAVAYRCIFCQTDTAPLFRK